MQIFVVAGQKCSYVAAAPIYVAAAPSGQVPKVFVIDFCATLGLFANPKGQFELLEDYSDT